MLVSAAREKYTEKVSIRARHCWRANPAATPPNHRKINMFQSAPAIAGGRIELVGFDLGANAGFNPRPPLLAGEYPPGPGARHVAGFNPRPPLLAGE